PAAPPSFLRQPPSASARSATASRSAKALRRPLLSDFMFLVSDVLERITADIQVSTSRGSGRVTASKMHVSLGRRTLPLPREVLPCSPDVDSAFHNHLAGSTRSDSNHATAERAPPATSATRTPLSHGGRYAPSIS